ncbi:MAG: NAD(+)/NADH kinase [Bacteroidales bacterium]|jgi:NAD+ kinase|nr:NAD(+)/NADH kinase [Bacteroidales bacterium]
MLKSVAIYSKDSNEKTVREVISLINELSRLGLEVFVHRKPARNSYRNTPAIIFSNTSIMQPTPDMALSVGGDGTFLETAMRLKDTGIPIAGINTGRLGFLANIPAEDIERSCAMLVNNEYTIVERSCLKIEDPILFSIDGASALNDITIQKEGHSMITVNVEVDGSYLNTYWADGLIISTATGSTAYNLSAGGPILSPGDTSIIISPISPHNLTIRPIVLSGKSRLKLSVEGRSRKFLITCDFRSVRIPLSEDIHIAMDKVKLKTVMLNGTDFYSTLRNKLMWGMDRRN